MSKKKVEEERHGELKFIVLIAREIDEVLKLNIKDEYKVVLVKYLMQEWRK